MTKNINSPQMGQSCVQDNKKWKIKGMPINGGMVEK